MRPTPTPIEKTHKFTVVLEGTEDEVNSVWKLIGEIVGKTGVRAVDAYVSKKSAEACPNTSQNINGD